MFIIDKNCSNVSTTGAFGYINLRLDDFMIIHNKMMYKSNERTAKTEKYSVIGFDCIKNHVITTLTASDKKKGFAQSTEPTRLRRFPIGFNTTGLIGCFFPLNISSKVYFDNESSKEITSYDKKTVDDDIYDLLGYNPKGETESPTKGKKELFNKKVSANQIF